MKTSYTKHLKLAIALLLGFAANYAKAQCSFTYTVGANGVVAFSGTASVSGPSTIYSWTFYGNTTTTYTTGIPTATHTFTANGTYQVGFGVTSPGCFVSGTVLVNTVPPTCTANLTPNIGANGSVTLTATTPTFSPAYYTWNFAAGSGGGYSTTYTSNPNASFTYSSNGCYVIGLQIGSSPTGPSAGCYNNLQNTVCVNTAPCNATPLTFNTYVGSNGMVSFFNTNGSALVPISGFSQVWNFGDGGSSTVTAGTSANHNYYANATYTVDLTIANTNYTPTCISTGSTVVTVTNVPSCSSMSANFSTSSSPCSGYVYFGNFSTGTVSGVSYSWDFGDGTNTVSPAGVAYTYTANGAYTVTLTATNNNYTPTCTSTHTAIVVVNSVGGAISANISYSVGANGNVTYTCNATPSSTSTIYSWNFNGSLLSYTGTPTASKTYTANGNYPVSVSVYNPNTSCSASANTTVNVNTVPCSLNANFSYGAYPCGTYISFANTTSGTVSGTSYLWSFGDGSAYTLNSLSPAYHNYIFSGTYIATLTATNNNFTPACVSTHTAVVTATTVATPAFTYSLGANGQVTFSNTSTGISSSSTSYTWNFGTQATPNYTQGFGNVPNTVSTTYAANGTYVVMFGIGTCYGSTQQTITINSVGGSTCNLNASFTYTQSSNGVVNFNNTSIGTTTNTSYHWVFGDGGNSNAASPSHAYASNGTYTVLLTDSTGICGSTYVALISISSVTNVPCNLNTNFTFTTGANGICYFNNTTTGAIAQTTYTWSFGDGNSSSANSPSHTYANNGNYLVTLYANLNPAAAGPLACMDSTSHNIIISNITNTCIANTTFSLIPAGSPHYWYAVVTNTGNVAAAQWAWGDSTANSFGIVTSHTYAASGNYNICLTVTTTCGAIGMHCSSQYLNKTSGESEDIIYINCITPDMLPTGIKNNSAEFVSCVIAPNPNGGEFNVSVSGVNSAAKIQVYNLIGELIFETPANESNNGSINKNISLNNASNGVYFIKVSAGDKIHTQKLIINK